MRSQRASPSTHAASIWAGRWDVVSPPFNKQITKQLTEKMTKIIVSKFGGKVGALGLTTGAPCACGGGDDGEDADEGVAVDEAEVEVVPDPARAKGDFI